jgi:DNA-binding NarL/FixJ family response regulator
MRTVKDLHKFSKELNVLYVEDDQNLREETTSLLKTLFKTITTANDGQYGLDEYNQDAYDLIISDVNMPRMNGIDMCINIKEINPEQKILIVSAHDESETLMSLIKTGASGFILKPMP